MADLACPRLAGASLLPGQRALREDLRKLQDCKAPAKHVKLSAARVSTLAVGISSVASSALDHAAAIGSNAVANATELAKTFSLIRAKAAAAGIQNAIDMLAAADVQESLDHLDDLSSEITETLQLRAPEPMGTKVSKVSVQLQDAVGQLERLAPLDDSKPSAAFRNKQRFVGYLALELYKNGSSGVLLDVANVIVEQVARAETYMETLTMAMAQAGGGNLEVAAAEAAAEAEEEDVAAQPAAEGVN